MEKFELAEKIIAGVIVCVVSCYGLADAIERLAKKIKKAIISLRKIK